MQLRVLLPVSESTTLQAGPLPTIEGIQVPLSQQNTGIPSSKSPLPTLPLLTPQDMAQYMGIFQSCKSRNGLLTGLYHRSLGLNHINAAPNSETSLWSNPEIHASFREEGWANMVLYLCLFIFAQPNISGRHLADTQNRGALDSIEFAIGMHLIKTLCLGQLSAIPTSLPPGLYKQASSGGIISSGIGGSSSFQSNPTHMVDKHRGPGALQNTGQTPHRKTQIPNPPGTLCPQCSDFQAQLASISTALDRVKAERKSLKQALDARIADVANLTAQNKYLRAEMEKMANGHHGSGIIQTSRNKSGITNAIAGPSDSQLDSEHDRTRHPSQARDTDSPTAENEGRKLSQNNDRNLSIHGASPHKPKRGSDSTRNIRGVFKCSICMDKQPEDYATPLDSCGHTFCRDCIKNYVGAKLAERCFPIMCPVCMADDAQGGDRGSA